MCALISYMFACILTLLAAIRIIVALPFKLFATIKRKKQKKTKLSTQDCDSPKAEVLVVCAHVCLLFVRLFFFVFFWL